MAERTQEIAKKIAKSDLEFLYPNCNISLMLMKLDSRAVIEEGDSEDNDIEGPVTPEESNIVNKIPKYVDEAVWLKKDVLREWRIGIAQD